MFNLQGSEIIFILLLALVVLGPEKLPGAIQRAMQTYAELRKLGSGFQSEFKSAIDEPMREMRETADLIKDQADPKRIAEQAERDAATAAAADKDGGTPANSVVTDEDAEDDETPVTGTVRPVDPFDDPHEESA